MEDFYLSKIKDIKKGKHVSGKEIHIAGWVRNKRSSNKYGFLSLHDGSCFDVLQIVVDFNIVPVEDFNKLDIGSSVMISGSLQSSQGDNQVPEILASGIKMLSPAKGYPLQPKKHSYEFLREICHLRTRTNIFNAIFRIRNCLAFAIHNFFQERNFIYINTPIITSNDCEGAGEMFTVTTLNPAEESNKHDNYYENDFFGKHVGLTVSGQLEAETAIFGLGKVYTFGPTFRAENSNTSRHLAEFWMVEPEMAFTYLNDDMILAEDFLKFVIKNTIERCGDEITFLDKKAREERGVDLLTRLQNIVEKPFAKISYTQAIEILLSSGRKFKYKINEWGCDLQSEHERFIVEEYFNNVPTIVTDYPKDIKAFYMRLNEDRKTVAAMDVLCPGIGEIIGGSQREERLDILTKAMEERHMNTSSLDWYLSTRRFGSVVHSGFGLGFERLVQFVTGVGNIRDVCLFPRHK